MKVTFISHANPRYDDSGRLVYQSKQFVKNLLGMTEEDLYDLQKWTIFRA